MNLFALAGIASGIATLALLVVVLLHDYKAKLNLHLAFLMLTVGGWGLGVYQIANVPFLSVGEAFFWWRITHISIIFIPISFFQFAYTFLEMKKRKLLYTMYGLGIFFLVANATPYFITSMRYVFNSFYFPSSPGILYILFFAFYVAVAAYTMYLFFKTYLSDYGDKKRQALIIFIAHIFAFGGGSLAFFPLFGIDIINPASGTFLIPVGPISFFYAIMKYRFLNTRLITTEFLTVSTWIFFILYILFVSNSQERFIDVSILFIVIALGVFAIKGAIKEASQRDELKYLNDHLEQKVAAQTQEVRQAYEVEKKARVELEELDKAKDQFILTTQHHLRTPLTIVKGYLQSFLTKKSQSLDEEGKTYLTKAEEATDRIGTLVNEFLDISQMQVGKSILNKKPTNIKNLLESVTKELEAETQKRNLTLKVEVENDTMLNIDPHKIREALTNLLDNSIKYNHEGGSITIKGEKTRHPIEREKLIYRLTIEDTGIGISPEELAHLFTQYFERGKEAEKLYTTGRGIGLTITKNIISAHNGRIYAESEGRGKGARFVVELPI